MPSQDPATPNQTAPKVMVIGWDGATWDYINPLRQAGKLPHLNTLLQRGAQAILRSTIPPFTNIAWPAMVTGLSPAKTGIFDGARTKPGSYEAVPTNLVGYKGIPIWHWLNHYGRSTAILNIPMTYPAHPLNGCLVTGFDSPLHSNKVAYPENLLDQWAREGYPYQVLAEEISLMSSQNPHHPRGAVTDFVSRWVQLTREQGQHVAWLWSQQDLDFLFVVFSGTDSINHRTRNFDHIAQVYQAADQALGDILAAVDDQTLICLVSDHGSTPAYRYLSLYHALHKGGWLHFRPQVAARFGRRLPGPLSQVWARLPAWAKRLLSWPLLRWDGRLAAAYDNIDWSRTKVFARSGMGLLYLNRDHRPQGCIPADELAATRDQVRTFLLTLKDEANQPLIRQVHLGETVYPNAHPQDDPPDLVIEPANWSDHMISGFPTDPLVRPIPDAREYGTHTPDGILLLAGPHTQAGVQLNPAHITDVMPTLCAAMGLPIPQEVDGQIVQAAFTHPLVENRISSDHIEMPSSAPTAAAEDNDEIMARLQALGYLD